MTVIVIDLDRIRADAARLRSEVSALESLLTYAEHTAVPQINRALCCHDAVTQVLRAAGCPLMPRAIVAALREGGYASDRTQATISQTVAATLFRRQRDMFERVDGGWQLRLALPPPGSAE